MPVISLPVKGYEHLYTVYSDGKIFSLRKQKFLKPDIGEGGYHRVQLSNKGKREKPFVHRLVALHFIDNPLDKPEVNHIDGDKGNNSVKNLEWSTRKENEVHSSKNGMKAVGTRNGNAKYTTEQLVQVFKLRELGHSHKIISERLGISRNYIIELLKGNFRKDVQEIFSTPNVRQQP